MQKPSRDYKGNAWMQSCFIENGGAAPKPPHIFQTAGSLFFASMQIENLRTAHSEVI